MNDSRHFDSVGFEQAATGELTIIDRIDRKRSSIRMPTAVDINYGTSLHMPFPVDTTVEFTVPEMACDTTGIVFVRRVDGRLIQQVDAGESESFPPDRYVLELGTNVNYYLEFESRFDIEVTTEDAVLQFDDLCTVKLGARSAHKTPAGTIRTSTSPSALMNAVSGLGSALKTLSPERSFPTLRGYPPLIKIDEQADGDTGFEAPCPSIEIVCPPRTEDIFTVVPLAYYLGAQVKSGPQPKLLIDSEPTLDFSTFEDFSTGVSEVLQHVFTMDCIVRTAGIYPVELAAAKALENQVDIDRDRLYEASPPDRLARYLDLPLDEIMAVSPTWPFVVHITDVPEHATMLPHLANYLALIRVHETDSVTSNGIDTRLDGSHIASSTSQLDDEVDIDVERHQFPTATGWVGPGYLKGSTKLIEAGYLHALGREPSSDDIQVTVVCNDSELYREFDALQSIYEDNSIVPFDVTVHQEISTDKLASIIEDDVEFLHYIGHVEPEGFVCTDGRLDPVSIDSVGVTMFLLNACDSYPHGRALIEQGAVAGIATTAEVIDNSAAWIGITLARLLNLGFDLNSAISILRPESLHGTDYLVLGAGQTILSQSESVPALLEIDTNDAGFDFAFTTVGHKGLGIGGIVSPHLEESTGHSLTYTRVDSLAPTTEELFEFLDLQEQPARLDGAFMWSSDIDSLPLSDDAV